MQSLVMKTPIYKSNGVTVGHNPLSSYQLRSMTSCLGLRDLNAVDLRIRPSMAGNFPDYMRDACAAVLSDELLYVLAGDLEIHRAELANKLGFPKGFDLLDGLMSWRENSGSTVHVLVCILTNLRRADCVDKILSDMDLHTMQLYLKIEYRHEDFTGAFTPRFRQVTTNTEFTLGQALENVLDGDFENYEIIGPGSWVQWSTLAKELKGQQLTLLYRSPSDNTDLKKTMSYKPDFSRLHDSNLFSQELDHTKIENLKLEPNLNSPSSSVKSDSNNVTSECQLQGDFSLLNHKTSSDSFSLTSLDNNMEDLSLHFETKTPLVTNNTSIQEPKTFRDKCVYNEETGDQINLLSQHPNMPHFSIIEDEATLVSNPNEIKQNNLSCNYPNPSPSNNLNSEQDCRCDVPQWIVFPNKVEVGMVLESLDTISVGESFLPEAVKNTRPRDSTSCEEDVYVSLSFIETVFGRAPAITEARKATEQTQKYSVSHTPEGSNKRLSEPNCPVYNPSLEHALRANHHTEAEDVCCAVSLTAENPSEPNLYRHTPPPKHHDLQLPQFVSEPQVMLNETMSQYTTPSAKPSQPSHYMQMAQSSQPSHYMEMVPCKSFNQTNFRPHLSPQQNQPELDEDYRATHVRHNSFPFLIRSNSNFVRNMPGVRNSFNSSHTEHNDSARETDSGVQYNNPNLCFEPFNPSQPTHDAIGQPMDGRSLHINNKHEGNRRNGTMIKSYSADDSRYNYIDPKLSQAKPINIEEELSQIEGWKSKENGDTILKTLEPYRNHDGLYVIWKSRRHKNFVLTVCHQQQYIHLRINETMLNKKKIYYIYENGFCSESLLELINHYRIYGIKTRVQAVGSNKVHNEHISLRKALK